MSNLCILLISLCFSTVLMFCLWLISLKQKKADIVDFGWTISLAGCGLIYSLLADGDPTRRLLLGVFTAFWGLRLGSHLFFDRVLRKEEDGRYVDLRASWGEKANTKFLLFFLVQGVLAFILSFQFLIVASNHSSINTVTIICSLLIFYISFLGETVADSQLKKFREDVNNRGKTCQVGLWNYSRHPNYFFEWIHWFSYVVLAFGSEIWLISLFNPIAMYYLITKVTGIPPTEARAIQSRGDNYREYQRTTSAFFPMKKRR